MFRNNLIALLIHAVIGAAVFIAGGLLFEYASAAEVTVALLVVYLLYFILSYLCARIHLFNRRRKKPVHVILPSLAMLAVITALYVLNFRSSSAIFGYFAGFFGQPVEMILAVTGDRLRSWFSIACVIAQCLLPSALIWLGLLAGGKEKLEGI